jgi:hypothetical protein
MPSTQPGRSVGLKADQELWVKSAAYPALMLSNWQYTLVKHPTHGDYREYRDKGNMPKNLQQWAINPVTLAIPLKAESNGSRPSYTS